MRRPVSMLVRFTDEELLLFDAVHPVVDAPYLSGLDEEQRRLAARIAYRSLCSHGAIAVDGGAGMELPETVVRMLQVRGSARSTLLISKTTPDVGLLRYHHFSADTVVIEDVTDDGIHEFRLIEPEMLADEVDAFCTIDGAADGRGEPVTLTVSSFAAGELARDLWGDGVAQFDATVWRAAREPAREQVLVGILLGTTGSWSSRRVLVPEESADRLIELHPVEAVHVGDRILRELFSAEGNDVQSDEWHLMRT